MPLGDLDFGESVVNYGSMTTTHRLDFFDYACRTTSDNFKTFGIRVVSHD